MIKKEEILIWKKKYSYFHLIEVPHSNDKDSWVLKADGDGKLEIMAGKEILSSEGEEDNGIVYILNKNEKKIPIIVKVKGKDYIICQLPMGITDYMFIRIGQQQAEKITKDYFGRKKI